MYLTLEDMECKGEIVTTDEIFSPLRKVMAGITENEAERVCRFAH